MSSPLVLIRNHNLNNYSTAKLIFKKRKHIILKLF
jgi:hypothetical protein